MAQGRDKKKRTRRKMTHAEYSKRHRTESIATIFKKPSVEDDEVAPTAPDAQLDNACKDAGIEQENDSDDAGGDEGGQKVDAVSRESVPQPHQTNQKERSFKYSSPPIRIQHQPQ